MGSRVFCRIKNGCIGMVPETSVPGDIVCAIMGAKPPFVIRWKPDGCYQLIGECCIHGMMNREILRLRISKKDLGILFSFRFTLEYVSTSSNGSRCSLTMLVDLE